MVTIQQPTGRFYTLAVANSRTEARFTKVPLALLSGPRAVVRWGNLWPACQPDLFYQLRTLLLSS